MAARAVARAALDLARPAPARPARVPARAGNLSGTRRRSRGAAEGEVESSAQPARDEPSEARASGAPDPPDESTSPAASRVRPREVSGAGEPGADTTPPTTTGPRAADAPFGVAPARPARPRARRLTGPQRLALFGLSAWGALVAPPTLIAIGAGSPRVALLGLAALGLGLGPCLAAWSRRRGALVAALLIAPSIPIVAPRAGPRHEGALVRSCRLPGPGVGADDALAPWFAGLPEEELIRAGEAVGWRGRERATVARRGGVWREYARFEGRGLFERDPSLVLDAWLADRRHYWLATPPGASPAAPAPLLVFLHGSGGPFRAYPAWLAQDAAEAGFATAYPTWGFGDWLSDEAADRVAAVIDDAARRAPVDPRRVVLVGLSAGGMGAVWVQRRHPDRFVGVVALSGAPFGPWQRLEPAVAARAPWLVVHGAQDGHVPVSAARRLVQALREAGGAVDYVEHPDDDHTLLLVRRAEVVGGLLAWARERTPASAPGR